MNSLGGEFHQQRTARIASGNAPTNLIDSTVLITHIIPRESIQRRANENFERMSAEPDRFLPMGSKILQESRITADGLLVGSNANGLSENQRAYTFVFRSGAVETVVSSITRGHEHDFVVLPMLQTLITDQTLRITKALNSLGYSFPYFAHVSLAGVGGLRLLQQWPEGAFPEDVPFGMLGHGLLYFDSATLNHVPVGRHACFESLRCTLSHLANAVGLSVPPPLN